MSTVTNSNSDSSDLSLAIRLQDGSTGAWGDFVELYGPLVESWLVKAGLNAAVREDLAQDVFLSVHRAIGTFDATREDATFRGWLWRITRNAVLQSLRKKQTPPRGGSTALAQLQAVVDPDVNPDMDPVTPGTCDPNDSLSKWMTLSEAEPPSNATDTAELLRRAMRQIKERVDSITWQAFWNTAVLNQSTADVAEDLGMTAAAVRKAKSRTIQRLRKQLGDQR